MGYVWIVGLICNLLTKSRSYCYLSKKPSKIMYFRALSIFCSLVVGINGDLVSMTKIYLKCAAEENNYIHSYQHQSRIHTLFITLYEIHSTAH